MPNLMEIYEQQKLKKQDPKSVFIDPVNITTFLGTKAKPGRVGYAILRNMAVRAKPVAAIITTRLNQMARYTRRPSYEGDTGFKITIKDTEREPSKEELKRAKEIEEALLKTGFIENRKRKDNFNMFMRKIVRDSLILDAMTFEVVPNLKGEVSEWYAVDGATIELIVDDYAPVVYQPVTPRGINANAPLSYVQVIDGQIMAEYTEEELAYAIRNPRTDIDYALFGLSELEILVETITHILNAESYNGAYFTHNNLPQGVLEIVGKYDRENLEAFKRAWKSLISGAVGKWKVPVMALEEGQGLKFTPFKQSSRDMEFHQWLEFLTTIACAVYQIDPAEIGMKPWSGGKEGMFNSDAEATRLDESKDKGFFPLMQFMADTLNSELINRIDPNFEFQWVGLNQDDENAKADRRDKRLTSGYTTVNEERMAEDKPTIEEFLMSKGFDEEEAKNMGKWAWMPMNQVASQYVTAGMQNDQQQQATQADFEKLKLQHQQELESQGYSHAQAVEMAEKQAKAEMQKMQMQHQQGLEQGQVQFGNQKSLQDSQNKFTADQGAVEHQRNLETGQVQFGNQKQLQDSQNKFTAEQGQVQHQQGLEATQQQFSNQKNLQDSQNKFSSEQAGIQHQRNLEAVSLKQKVDDPKKQKLKKSLNEDSENSDIIIDIYI